MGSRAVWAVIVLDVVDEVGNGKRKYTNGSEDRTLIAGSAPQGVHALGDRRVCQMALDTRLVYSDFILWFTLVVVE